MVKRSKISQKIRIPKADHEKFFKERGFNVICGVDEVGRGAWAGPLVAAAVILDKKLYGLRDSKLLDAKKRKLLAKKIKKYCRYGIGEVTALELNKVRLTKGTQMAFRRAIKALGVKPDFVLADGFKFESPIPCRALIKGDMICSSIAAASIVAKDYRDSLMKALDKQFKGYQFKKHKGYGTKLHQRILKKLGRCETHRIFYKSIK